MDYPFMTPPRMMVKPFDISPAFPGIAEIFFLIFSYQLENFHLFWGARPSSCTDRPHRCLVTTRLVSFPLTGLWPRPRMPGVIV